MTNPQQTRTLLDELEAKCRRITEKIWPPETLPKYLVVEVVQGGPMRTPAIQHQLDEHVSDGWELASVVTVSDNVQLISRKAKRQERTSCYFP